MHLKDFPKEFCTEGLEERNQNRARISVCKKTPKEHAKNKIRRESRVEVEMLKKFLPCYVCNKKTGLQTHHLDYVEGNFIIVCLRCHARFHRKYKKLTL